MTIEKKKGVKMKDFGWFVMGLILLVIIILGWLNQNNYKDCVERERVQCEDEMRGNCLVNAKDYCNWVKK